MKITNRIGVAAKLLAAINQLNVNVERITTAQLRLPGEMGRITTIIELHGDGHTGRGEDITYMAEGHEHLRAAFEALKISGERSFKEFSEHIDSPEIMATMPATTGDDKPGYHRWAIESAALDLALRQADTNLAKLIDEPFQPVRVSLSMGLGEPPSVEILKRWLERDQTISFKLDTSMDWDRALVAELAQLGPEVAATIDFKALYSGDWIKNDYPAELYEDVARLLPYAILEDARLDNPEREALERGGGLDRLSWDFPITQVSDVPGFEHSSTKYSDLRPGAINIKPSRFGSARRLLETISFCDEQGIACYSGGQYELGVGRTQLQTITSLCFPSAFNDCAPALFHGATPDDADLPFGPVQPPNDGVGFGWDAPTPAKDIE